MYAEAGWSSLALAVYCVTILLLNWSGYTGAQALTAVAIAIPAAALYLVIFARTVILELNVCLRGRPSPANSRTRLF